MSAARKSKDNYSRDILSAISREAGPKNSLINHEINGLQGQFVQSPEVNSAGTCEKKVICDLHYANDWDYKVKSSMSCAEARRNDPCFATNACICDNGFFRVSSLMPARESTESSKELAIVFDKLR